MNRGWKPEEIETLKRMRLEGSTLNEVAKALGRPPGSTIGMSRRLRETEGFMPSRGQRSPCAHHNSTVVVTPRKCLCCGGQFPSAHTGNRICSQCSRSEAFR